MPFSSTGPSPTLPKARPFCFGSRGSLVRIQSPRPFESSHIQNFSRQRKVFRCRFCERYFPCGFPTVDFPYLPTAPPTAASHLLVLAIQSEAILRPHPAFGALGLQNHPSSSAIGENIAVCQRYKRVEEPRGILKRCCKRAPYLPIRELHFVDNAHQY